MRPLVVLFALVAAACGSLVPLVAQPAHLPAILLDPHGRPLDTAEVIQNRAVHLQAKALEHAPLAHAVVAPAVVAAPLVSHHGASLWGSSLLAGHGHWLKKRSLGHLALAAPAVSYVGGHAVSHQSRVDVISEPAVVSHAAVVAPVLSHAVHAAPIVSAHASPLWGAHSLAGHGHWLKKRSLGLSLAAPLIVAPSAVSHQSRVDIISEPAIVSKAVVAPVLSHAIHAAPILTHATPIVSAPAAHIAVAGHAAPLWGAHSLAGHGHWLKKRSLGLALAAPVIAAPLVVAPSAVSHQSRVDIISKPAIVSHSVVAPVITAHSAWAPAHGLGLSHGLGLGHLLKKRSLVSPLVAAVVAPSAVSHQSRVDVISGHSPVLSHVAPIVAAPLAHSAVWTAPTTWAHSGLLHSSPLAHW